MALRDITFFGAADRVGKTTQGKIASEYPAWYHDVRIDNLEQEIAENERKMAPEYVGLEESEKAKLRATTAQLKQMHTAIIASKPNLSAKDKDELAATYQYLSEQISDSMYSRSEMNKGLANAHEEARRMKKPIISADKFVMAARKMGIEIPKGQKKISRDQATKVWKICGKLLGEETNAESLRKDYKHGTFHPDRSLEEMERDR